MMPVSSSFISALCRRNERDAINRATEKQMLTFTDLLARSSLAGTINRIVINNPSTDPVSKIVVNTDWGFR